MEIGYGIEDGIIERSQNNEIGRHIDNHQTALGFFGVAIGSGFDELPEYLSPKHGSQRFFDERI